MHVSEIPSEIQNIIRTVPGVNIVYQEWRESHLETDAPDGTFDESQWIQFCQRAMVVMDSEIDTITKVLIEELSTRSIARNPMITKSDDFGGGRYE